MSGEDFFKYQVRRKLREIGAYQVVFEAWDPGLERTVELRVLRTAVEESSEALEKFRTECRALAALDHPSFLKVLDVGHTRDHVFYVTDPPTGTPLAEYSALGPVPAEAAIEIGDQLAQALEYLHGRGLLHRGLTLGGIHYDLATGRAVICDYSVLKPMRGQAPTLQSMVGAEVLEAVPERLAGQPLDERSDLFLLGAVLYMLLTRVELLAPSNLGRWPSFEFPSVTEHLPDCPQELADCVMRALARDPAARPATAAAFAEELRAARRKHVVRRVSQGARQVSLSGSRPIASLASSARRSAALEVPPAALAPPQPARSWRGPLLAAACCVPLVAVLTWAAWPGPDTTARSGVGSSLPTGPAPTPGGPGVAPEGPGATALDSPASGPASDPSDIVALAAESRGRPTGPGTFLKRWDGVCAWADRPPTPGSPSIPPRELTRIRMLSFRDMPTACRQLDELLRPFAPPQGP